MLKGTVARNLIVVSSNANLFHNADRPPPEPDEGAIADFDLRIETWLNDHLNDLQGGGEGKLEDVAAPGLLDDAAPDVIAGISTELASEERPGLEATYKFTIAHAGIPEWIRADVYVRTDDEGSTQAASYIFVPGDGGAAVLIMAEPHPNDGGSGPTGGGASEDGGGQPSESGSEESQ